MHYNHYSREQFRQLQRRWDKAYFFAALAFVLSLALLFACTIVPDSGLINPLRLKNPELFPLGGLLFSSFAFFLALVRLKTLASKGWPHTTNTES